MAGANLGNVGLYLRSFRDALAIREILLTEKHVVVVGSGYLGAEVSSFLTSSGAKLSLLSRDKVIWQDLLDPETAQWLTDSYAESGIQLLLNENLNGFEGKTVIKNIQTKSGMRFPAGLAVVAIGTEPNLQLVALTLPLAVRTGAPSTNTWRRTKKGFTPSETLPFIRIEFTGVPNALPTLKWRACKASRLGRICPAGSARNLKACPLGPAWF